MRTIHKLISFDLSDRDREILKSFGWVNGCGGKGGINFSKIIKNNIETFNNFDHGKAEQLFDDIEYYLCWEHDIRFSLGGNYLDFYKANFIFAKGLFKLIRFANFGERLFIGILVYCMLNKFGKEYFYFGKKRTLKYLLNNKD